MQPSEPRVALVHDFLLDLRGGERVFLAFCGLFPDADLFTAVYDPVGTEGRFADRTVHTSFLQKLHPNSTSFRRLLPLYPYAMEAMDLSAYDLVLSSSSAWAHGVLPSENAVHVCYCHNPFRYAWNAREATLRARGPIMRAALGVVLQRWRQWDWIAAQRVDRYIANSETTRRRIARYFTREAEVVYPPVEIERFAPGIVGDHYAVLSELMPHKRIDLAVRAFNRLRLPLVVIGDGPDARRLERLAGPTVRFTGRVADADVARLLASARALVVTATEEFGIAAVEAQAAGRPVIALAEGGVTESVLDGRTGVFYEDATPEALAAAVSAFDPLSIDPAECVANAQRFGVDGFARDIRANVEQALAAGPSPRGDRRRPARGLALAGRRAA
jgi:glycosyltransferase involved in cell wall biosynthesis